MKVRKDWLIVKWCCYHFVGKVGNDLKLEFLGRTVSVILNSSKKVFYFSPVSCYFFIDFAFVNNHHRVINMSRVHGKG